MAINEQINSEYFASYTYLAMSAYCERQKFLGAAKWLQMQAEEEQQHGMKLFHFVLARDGSVEDSAPSSKPKSSCDSLQAVFEQALTARTEGHQPDQQALRAVFFRKAFAEMTELQWFLTEQVEERRSRARSSRSSGWSRTIRPRFSTSIANRRPHHR